MAKILVRSDKAQAEVWDDAFDADDSHYVFRCERCGTTDTDRGDLADTIAAAEIHVDLQCPFVR